MRTDEKDIIAKPKLHKSAQQQYSTSSKQLRRRELNRRKKRRRRLLWGICIVLILSLSFCIGSQKANRDFLHNSFEILSDVYFKTNKQSQKCIVIDPGHGGEDPGSLYQDIYESNINLPIAKMVKSYLEELGYLVIMTREDDTNLSPKERVAIAESAKADLLISIHQNSLEYDTVTKGMETLYNSQANELNSVLAEYIQNETSSLTKAKDRGILSDTKVILIREATMPSCLIEVGFLSSDKERELLITPDYQEKAAQGIANGIDKFLNRR